VAVDSRPDVESIPDALEFAAQRRDVSIRQVRGARLLDDRRVVPVAVLPDVHVEGTRARVGSARVEGEHGEHVARLLAVTTEDDDR